MKTIYIRNKVIAKHIITIKQKTVMPEGMKQYIMNIFNHPISDLRESIICNINKNE